GYGPSYQLLLKIIVHDVSVQAISQRLFAFWSVGPLGIFAECSGESTKQVRASTARLDHHVEYERISKGRFFRCLLPRYFRVPLLLLLIELGLVLFHFFGPSFLALFFREGRLDALDCLGVSRNCLLFGGLLQ